MRFCAMAKRKEWSILRWSICRTRITNWIVNDSSSDDNDSNGDADDRKSGDNIIDSGY